jgi:REP element-mobilizing transposase RayT
MSRKYKFRNPEGIYIISFATVYWLDLFTRNIYKDILLESWKYCQASKGLDIYAWVIMSNHVYMIIGSKQDKKENIICDMKSFTSRNLKESIQNNIQESRREWMLWMLKRSGQKIVITRNFICGNSIIIQ